MLRGHRSGLEPVLMAAWVPARPGQRVLEGGAGAGAGLLCLAARVSPLDGVGVELNPALAALARRNLAANGATGIEVLAADLAAGHAPAAGGFHHAFANPPWHAGTASPDGERDLARRTAHGLLPLWVAALCRSLRHRGTVTLAPARRGARRGGVGAAPVRLRRHLRAAALAAPRRGGPPGAGAGQPRQPRWQHACILAWCCTRRMAGSRRTRTRCSGWAPHFPSPADPGPRTTA